MKSKNIYKIPIDLHSVTKISRKSIAHVGEMKHAIDFDAPEGTPALAVKNLDWKSNSRHRSKYKSTPKFMGVFVISYAT